MGGGKGFGSYKELENKATDPQVKLGQVRVSLISKHLGVSFLIPTNTSEQ